MPTITGAHSIIYSKSAEADRAFLRDVLGLPGVDVGGGWLIFAVPPAEVAVHPSEENNIHEFYLMTDDIRALIDAISQRGVKCTPPHDQGWGVLTQVSLPGGGKIGIYEPRHPRPVWKEPKGSAPRKTSKGIGSRKASKGTASRRKPKRTAPQRTRTRK